MRTIAANLDVASPRLHRLLRSPFASPRPFEPAVPMAIPRCPCWFARIVPQDSLTARTNGAD